MNKKIMAILVIVLSVGLIVGYQIRNTTKEFEKQTTSPSPAITKNNCISDECLLNGVDFPVKTLPANIEESLVKGLDDEYKAYATYQAIMDMHGSIRPFVMIARAEQQHIAALQALFDKYAIQIPENNYLGDISSPGSIQEACAIGVEAEIENVELYKNVLLPIVVDYPDITQVYTNLMNASEQKHLPAFNRCD